MRFAQRACRSTDRRPRARGTRATPENPRPPRTHRSRCRAQGDDAGSGTRAGVCRRRSTDRTAVVRIHERDAQRSRVGDRNIADKAAAACRAVGDERRRERRRRAVEQRGERNIECGRGGAIDIEAHADRRINAGRDAKAGRHPEARDSADPARRTARPLRRRDKASAADTDCPPDLRCRIAAIVAAAVEAMARTFEHGVGGIERRDRPGDSQISHGKPDACAESGRRSRVRPREERDVTACSKRYTSRAVHRLSFAQ